MESRQRRARAGAGTDLVVVAHPDDETISLSAELARTAARCRLWTVTDGAPRSVSLRPPGFASREQLAATRRREQLRALRLVGLRSKQCVSFGIVDQEAANHLVELTSEMFRRLRRLRPRRIFTHAYEGGHPDHDATAFAVHHARELLRAEGGAVPALYEFASYHRRAGKLRVFEFLHPSDGPVTTIVLSAKQRARKREMYECFASQQPLDSFPIRIERYRVAPRYDFTRPLVSTFHRYPWSATGSGLAWFRELATLARAKLLVRAGQRL